MYERRVQIRIQSSDIPSLDDMQNNVQTKLEKDFQYKNTRRCNKVQETQFRILFLTRAIDFVSLKIEIL